MSVECATLSVEAAARRLGISRGYAYELITVGDFPARVLTIGTRKRVVAESLERYIATGVVAHGLLTDERETGPRGRTA